MSRPQVSAAVLRKLVREVLALAPGYNFTDAMLARGVGELVPGNHIVESDLLAAAEWNLAKDYISVTAEGEDSGEREWRITSHGIAKQNLA